jgi:hypothetical protein
MQKNVQHHFEMNADDFFSKVYLNEEYIRRMHLEGMDNETFEILSQSGTLETSFKRTIRTTPKLNAPKVVKKLLGDSVQYVEDGTYSPETKHYVFSLIPSTLADKVKIQGDLWVESTGANQMTRFCNLTFHANIFGAGKVVEKFIAQSSIENLEKSARFTHQWIRDHL